MTGKGNVSENLPSGQLSNIPWRKAGVKYNNNEAYFDIKENVSRIKEYIYVLKVLNLFN